MPHNAGERRTDRSLKRPFRAPLFKDPAISVLQLSATLSFVNLSVYGIAPSDRQSNLRSEVIKICFLFYDNIYCELRQALILETILVLIVVIVFYRRSSVMHKFDPVERALIYKGYSLSIPARLTS